MPPTVKKRSAKTGLPPGSLIHVGTRRRDKARISLIDYDEKQVQEKTVKNVKECFPFRKTSTVTWINVEGIHQPEVISVLGEHFGLHPLLLEDITTAGQRPKLDDYGDYIFIVLQMLSYDQSKKSIIAEQVSLVLGENFVISFQEGIKGDVFEPVRERIRSSKGRIRSSKSDYLAYMLIDAIIDNYFVILEKVGDHIEKLEEKIVKEHSPEISRLIHHLKRELIYLRKATWPVREVLSGMERSESKLVHKNTRIYLKDIYDHTVQVIETIETFRDLSSGLLDIYFSGISNKLNEVIKVLTIIGTIFIPLTFVTGIYGMNFDFMPELRWQYGYFLALGIMGLIALLMLWFFRRKKWI